VAKRRDPLLGAFGRRVRELRDTKGWTQEVLAERASLDRSYIAGIEAGLRNPSLKALAKTAKGFGLSLSEFFETVEF
jgi:transcriptional regulator with XRE-family HTH domain